MKKTKIKISYWTYPEGKNFEGLDEFKNSLKGNYDVEIKSQKTDALGGGLYELVINIINNLTLEQFISSYIQDGIKLTLALYLGHFFKKIKFLFENNQKFRTDVEKIKFEFEDSKIFIYSLYKNSLIDNFEEILKFIVKNYEIMKKTSKNKIKEIHIPIFDKEDYYKLCRYRVKLKIDENIPNFQKKDYFKFWGVRTYQNDFIYSIKSKQLSMGKFYTQKQYDILSKNL
jgi:hypothetical protein